MSIDANKSESSSQSEKLAKVFSYFLRGVGCLFLLFGVAMTIRGIWRLLLHPDSKVNFNDVETTAIGPKLFIVFFPLLCGALFLFLALRFERTLRRAFLPPAISPLGEKRDPVHVSAMSPRTIKLSWEPGTRQTRYQIGAVFVVLCTACVVAFFRVWLVDLVCSLFALLGFFVLIEYYTQIDADTRRVTKEGRLFGRFRLWLRSHRLNEFTAVVMERQSADPDDTVFLCLQRPNGTLMRICCFSYVRPGGRCVEAEELAQSLAKLTGLPLPRPSSLDRSA